MPSVALVLVYNAKKELLLGKRSDNDKFTIPGGHLNEGEEPREGALREVAEETGLKLESLSFVQEFTTKSGVHLHIFSGYTTGTPHGNNDPDQEVGDGGWKWVDVSEGLPKNIFSNLHGPDDPKDNAVKQMYDMKKAEDEVLRLLDHPDINERLMGLKLNSVTSQHLQLAALDPHPAIHEAAISHPHFGEHEGLALCQATSDHSGAYPIIQQSAYLSDRDRIKPFHLAAFENNTSTQPADVRATAAVLLAAHPDSSEEILRKLYADVSVPHGTRLEVLAHPNVGDDTLESAFHTGMTIPSPEATALAMRAVEHTRMSPLILQKLIQTAEGGTPQAMELAEHALATNNISPSTQEDLFRNNLVRRTPEAARLLAAMLRGPLATPEMLQRAMRDAGNDPAMMSMISTSPHFGPEHLEQLVQKSELSKAIDPSTFSSVSKAIDPTSRTLVDHKPDLGAHPPAHAASKEAYKTHVLDAPHVVKGLTAAQAGASGGVGRKRIFQAHVPGHPAPSKFLVKPYNEKLVRRFVKDKWCKHPHLGWAEMTTQSLFHAGGIGHLHQDTHVAEHDMGPGHEKEPALVIHMAPNHRPVAEGGLAKFRHVSGGYEHADDIRKIAIMDMLSNNNDRHSGNLLINQDNGKPLAIDHSLNFQYLSPRTISGDPDEGDIFKHYIKTTTLESAAPFHRGPTEDEADEQGVHNAIQASHVKSRDNFANAFKWWGEAGSKIRETFHSRLDQIKDPEVRNHLKRNFDARADWLDHHAKNLDKADPVTWAESHILTYRPGELTNEEKAQRLQTVRDIMSRKT